MPKGFNWIEQNNVLQWMIPTLLAGGDRELFDKVEEATDKFTNVDLKVTINGVNVPVEHLIKSVEDNVEYQAKKIAKERLSDPGINRIVGLISEFAEDVKNNLFILAEQAGFEFDPDED